MATLKQLKTNFVAGELDLLMLARPDIKHYHNAARRMRNVVSIPQGGFRTRPGSLYLDSFDPSNVRMASFQYTTDESYLFVFTHLLVTIYYENVAVKTLVTPYTSSDLISHFSANGEMISCGINWTQTLDTMVVYHEAFAPRLIKRGAAHDDWTISTAAFDNIPRVDFGAVYTNGVDEVQQISFQYSGTGGSNWEDSDTFVLILEDEETEPIMASVIASNELMATRMQDALRGLPNVYGDDITVTATVPGGNMNHGVFIVSFGGRDGQRPWGAMNYRIISSIQVPGVSIVVTTRGEYPGEDALSDARGLPRCGVFFQGRHWMAGSKALPNTVWATRAGTDWDLNNKRTTDDYGFQYSADTDDVPTFINFYPGRHLQIFSTAGEFYVPVSDREGVTPKNMTLRRTSSRGSKPGLRVAEVDGATVFVQWGGQALREFIYADTEAAYQANSISILASHLMRDPISLSMRRASSTDDADLMFMPNPDGSMSVFCTLRTQEVNAFTLWTTDGSYKDVCPIYDNIYQAVMRVIDGQERLCIELMDEEMPMDCGIKGGAASSASLPWLPNTLLDVVLDDAVQPQATTDEHGLVTFERASEESFMVGIPWPDVEPAEYPGYRWLVETLPPDADLQDGTMFGRKRRIVWVAFRMHETNGLIVNKSRVAMRRYGGQLLDRPNPRVTGIKTLKGLLGYDYEGKVTFGETAPTQATVLALSWAVSI